MRDDGYQICIRKIRRALIGYFLLFQLQSTNNGSRRKNINKSISESEGCWRRYYGLLISQRASFDCGNHNVNSFELWLIWTTSSLFFFSSYSLSLLPFLRKSFTSISERIIIQSLWTRCIRQELSSFPKRRRSAKRLEHQTAAATAGELLNFNHRSQMVEVKITKVNCKYSKIWKCFANNGNITQVQTS